MFVGSYGLSTIMCTVLVDLMMCILLFWESILEFLVISETNLYYVCLHLFCTNMQME